MSVLVGMITGGPAEVLVARGVEEARLRGVRLELIHIAHVGLRTDDPDALLSARRSVEQWAERARDEGVEAVGTQVMTTRSAGEALSHEAAERRAELLVIGGSKRSRVGKLLFGSTAQQVMLSSPCPVLALPASAHGW